jgi:hypothetical protein
LNINLQKLQLLIPWDLEDYNIQKSIFSFALHFQIKLSIHGSNFNFRFVRMSELELFLLMGGLNSKLQYYRPYKNSSKKKKTSYSYHSGHIEGDVMQNHEQKKKVKKSEKPRFYGQNKLFFWEPCPLALGQF